MKNFPFLGILTLLPLVGAIVVGLIPRAKAELAKRVALIWSLAVLVLSIVMWITFKVGGGSGRLRRLQTGFVRSYALSILGGALIVVAAMLAVTYG